ncbi:hypothetical protein ABN584_00335 [Gloeocapsa sp. BRSZ]
MQREQVSQCGAGGRLRAEVSSVEQTDREVPFVVATGVSRKAGEKLFVVLK